MNVSGITEYMRELPSTRTFETVYAVSVMFEVAVYRVDVTILLSAPISKHIVALATYLWPSQTSC